MGAHHTWPWSPASVWPGSAWQLAQQHGFGWLGLRVLILRALIADALGDRKTAFALLARAVVRGGTEKIVRPFVDEGTSLAVLLAALHAAAVDGRDVPGRTATYVDLLLAHFPGQTPASLAGRALVEPPSDRELDVLRLLAAGRSNAEMARDLVVEQSTIKTHLLNLYGKLGVHSRTQAVARARALQLLD